MNNLSLFILGLALIPACFAEKHCFSEPSYPCCKGNKVVYTDKSGDWGVEDGQWCGIGGEISEETCFATAQGYPCCKENKVVYTDESGDWGIENGKWCGIGNGNGPSKDCFAADQGYPCCDSCKVKYTDKSGDWGFENGNWCGIKDSCSTDIEIKDNPDFDFTFLKMENEKNNMLYSPLSIKYALKMLLDGALDSTYTEISNVLGNVTLPKYKNIDEVLSLVNGLIVKEEYFKYIKTEYINTLKEKYEAEVRQDGFKDATNINKWIEDNTLGIIKDMLSDEAVQNPDLVMLIINALAIDMEWKLKFDSNDTNGRKFIKDNGEEIIATSMFHKEIQSDSISYYKDDNTTAVTMDLKDYNGTQLEFMAIMPEENLSGFVENVTKEQISNIDNNLTLSSDTRDGVNVQIPKFDFDYTLKLKDDLKKLGIKEAFDKVNAQFSKMADEEGMQRRLYVEDTIHVANIEFTESGVKAAAVTVVMVGGWGGGFGVPKNPVNIIIDKPFMFIIRDKATKDIWFTGTVYEPNLWENDQGDYNPFKGW